MIHAVSWVQMRGARGEAVWTYCESRATKQMGPNGRALGPDGQGLGNCDISL